MNKTDQLRILPAVDRVLRSDKLAEIRRRQSPIRLAEWVREGIDRCRQSILSGVDLDEESAFQWVVDHVCRRHDDDGGQIVRRVINATGVVLHTNLGRAPLAERAIERMRDAVAYANVELDLQSGRRSKRGERVTRLLAQLAGSEAALVVNNCAAATMLVLQATAAGKEVIVSRGQLVEIGGGFRLPDVFRSAGVILREVGTTNRTYLRDYEAAIGDSTGAIIRVHHSNFRLSGFVTEPTIDELATVDRREEVPVIDDLGSGCIEDLSAYGLAEPTVSASVTAGADLTLFSGDKLFGGPQCGIIVGRSKWIDALRGSPMMRAMRVDKLTLAALEATTEIHLAGDAMSELPTLRMLSTEPNVIRQRCERACDQVSALGEIEVVECESQVGGGSIPGEVMKSYGLRVSGPHADDVAHRLRTGEPAIQARVTDDSVLLDLRTVDEHEIETLAARLSEVLQRCRNDSA